MANATAHGVFQSKYFSHQGASARADIAFFRGEFAGCYAGLVARLRIGPDFGVAHRQVKQHGGGHDGYQAKAHGQANALFFKPLHDTTGGIQPPGAAACQRDGVHAIDQIGRVQQVGLAGARCRAPHIDARDRAFAGDDDGAAGGSTGVGEVADFNASHLSDGASE